MSEENVDLVRAAYQAFSRGDFSPNDTLPGDFELVLAREMPDAGTYRGEVARRWLAAWVHSFQRLVLEPTEFMDAGDNVVVGFVQKGWVGGSDSTVELPTWGVATIRDGIGAEPPKLVARIQLFTDRSAALEAAGLSE